MRTTHLAGWLLGAAIAVALALFGAGCSHQAEPIGSTIMGEEELPFYDGRCGIKGCQGDQGYQTEAQEWRPTQQTPTATPDVSVRHDQGKESIRVNMLVGDTITTEE